MSYKHINQLINDGYIVFSEAAEEEFNEEQNQPKEKEEKPEGNNEGGKKGILDEFMSDMTEITSGGEDPTSSQEKWNEDDGNYIDQNDDQNNENPDDNFDDIKSNEFWNERDQREEEYNEIGEFMDSNLSDDNDYTQEIKEENPINKIQTVDVISKVVEKYIEYTNKVDLMTWNEIVSINPLSSKTKKKQITKWDYVEDIKKLIDKTFGNENILYVDVFNKLYETLTTGKWDKGLAVYSQKNYGSPFVTEGIFLLMYELAIDWAGFLIKFFSENPEIDANKWEEDSFVKKFPNLTLLSYVARLITESDEFNEFMTSEEAFKLTTDENEFNLTMKQVQKKKSLIKASGESLTYYANLVKNDYADILAGALNKLGMVIYLHTKCKISFDERLNIINETIKLVTSRRPIMTGNEPDLNNDNNIKIETTSNSTPNMLKGVVMLVDNLILARSEARMLLDSDKSNYIYIENNNE